MPDFMQYLRLKNLFGQPDMIGNDLPEQGGIMGNLNVPPLVAEPRSDLFGNINFSTPDVTQMGTTNVPGPSDYNVSQRMRELYTPESEATNRFNRMIGSYPNREDYKPSMLRRIGSALIALGPSFNQRGQFQANPEAISMGMGFLEKPYTEKLSDWKNRIGPSQQAATLERNQNVNERTMAYQTISQELRQKSDEARAKNQEDKAKIAADRAEVYRIKSLMPQHQFDFSGPTVKVGNKQTGEVQDTGIATGSLSDADKLALQQSNAMAQISARVQGQKEIEGVKQGGREAIAETRGWKIGTIPDPDDPSKQIGVQYNEITGEVKPIKMSGKSISGITKPSAIGGKPESPSQIRIRQFNTARELANTNPELRKFIKLGTPGSNDFIITPPSEGMFGHSGPTAEQYQAIQNAVYGNTPMSPISSHAGGPQRIVKTQRNTKTGATRQVESLDGGKTWQPVKQ